MAKDTSGNSTGPLSGFGYFLRNFGKKHRLSVRDRGQDSEVWYIFISPLRISLAMLGLLIVLIGLVILLVVYTPVLDLLPGNPGRKSREVLMQSVMRIDSLQNELRMSQVWEDNIAQILAGKVPLVPSTQGQNAGAAGGLVGPDGADSLLRAQMEGDGRFALSDGSTSGPGGMSLRMEFIAPMRGVVTSPFDPQGGRPGVGITPTESQEIVAAQSGTVTMSQWTPENGFMIEIQHADNFLTFYKQATGLLKAVGDRVQTGEVIGFMAPGESTGHGELLFELWSSGTPVDPRKYMYL